MNEIVARGMIKQQQMRRNRSTVRPFLDLRAAILDGTRQKSFRRLYPDVRSTHCNNQVNATA